jgi:hypothetical protein
MADDVNLATKAIHPRAAEHTEGEERDDGHGGREWCAHVYHKKSQVP